MSVTLCVCEVFYMYVNNKVHLCARTCLSPPPPQHFIVTVFCLLLQAANVHTLLANGPLVDSVVFQLRKTAGLLGG